MNLTLFRWKRQNFVDFFLVKDLLFLKWGGGGGQRFFFTFRIFVKKGRKKLFLNKKSNKKKGIFGKVSRLLKFWNPKKGKKSSPKRKTNTGGGNNLTFLFRGGGVGGGGSFSWGREAFRGGRIQIFIFSPNPIFHDQKLFFCKKNIFGREKYKFFQKNRPKGGVS